MPIAFVQRNPNKTIFPALRAAEGFHLLGYHVEWFDELPELDEDCIVAGYIATVREAVYKITGVYPEVLNYPNELQSYLGRTIGLSTLGTVRNSPDIWPIFMKPATEVKSFTGTLVSNIRSLYSSATLPPETPVWISEPIKFISEYRCFVQLGEVIGCRHYKGDPLVFPLADLIKDMIYWWRSAPAAYCLDVGVTDEGDTRLVEINSGFSAGDYGLDPILYARWLETWWGEATGRRAIP